MSSPLSSGISYSREGVATTLAVDLVEILMDVGFNARLAGLWISQSSDVGDAAEEMLRWRHIYGNTASGSGGAAADEWDTGLARGNVAVGSVETFNTTPASGGTPSSGVANSFNIRAGEQLWFPPSLEPQISQPSGSGELNVIRLMAAPADSLTMSLDFFLYKES